MWAVAACSVMWDCTDSKSEGFIFSLSKDTQFSLMGKADLLSFMPISSPSLYLEQERWCAEGGILPGPWVEYAWNLAVCILPFVCFFFFVDKYCNPTLLIRTDGNATTTSPDGGQITAWWDAPSIVGLIIFILCTFFIRWDSMFMCIFSEKSMGYQTWGISWGIPASKVTCSEQKNRQYYDQRPLLVFVYWSECSWRTSVQGQPPAELCDWLESRNEVGAKWAVAPRGKIK